MRFREFKVSDDQASSRTPGFCGLDRIWKFGKLSHVSQSTLTYHFESEGYEKSVGTGRGSANPAGRKDRHLPRLEAHPKRGCYNPPDSSLGKRRMTTADAQIGIPRSNSCIDR